MAVNNIGLRRTRHLMCFSKRTCFNYNLFASASLS